MKQWIFGLLGGTIVGGGIAALVTNKFVKEKYKSESEALVQRELESIKKEFSVQNTKEKVTEKKPITETYAKIVKDNGYSENPKPHKKNEVKIITPEEYGNADYDQLSFTYYSGDKVVTNDADKPMSEEDIAEFLGSRKVFDHFGEYEDDSIFVRNAALKADIEILLFEGKYSEQLKK